jgi:hypothetical protein
VHFSLVLFLALSAVIDLHIELRRATVVVEEHEKPLLEVMVFRKLGPAVPEVYLTASTIVHLHLIGSSSPRSFAKNCFTKLAPIHELGEFQWNMLYLTTLSAGDAEEGIDLGRRSRRSIARSNARALSGSRYLGFVFTPHRAAKTPLHRCGRRGHHRGILRFILTTAGTVATSLLHLHIGVQIGTASIRHLEVALGGKTLDEMRRKNTMRWRK